MQSTVWSYDYETWIQVNNKDIAAISVRIFTLILTTSEPHLQFDPHTEENGCCVEDEPGDPEAEQDQARLLVPEQDSEQDDEGGEDPDDEDPLVEKVVECEPHVRGQLLQTVHVLLHGQLNRN